MKTSMRKRSTSGPRVFAPHSVSGDAVCKHFEVDPKKGLSTADVEKARAKYGKNELDEEPGKSLFTLIMEQFEDLLVRILLLAACISFVLAYIDDSNADEGWVAYVEPLVILLILIANAFVGVWQESNAESALAALKKLQPEHAQTLRNGKWVTLEAAEVVPGDIVEVRVGDRVPADLRLLELKTTSMRIEQSQLTGESQSVSKDPEDTVSADAVIQAKTNMLFASTSVSNGGAICIVVATGMRTEIGVIQAAVKEAAEDEENTPLQQKLDEFGELLAKVIFIICAVVWIINYKHFFDPVHGTWYRGCIYYFKIAVALAVAAIPEGLPAVITTCLALGTRKMAEKNCIVRKLPSVETLGCTTVICSDKTGTLTTNEMVAVRFVVAEDKTHTQTYTVEGVNYAPIGKIDQGFENIKDDGDALSLFARCGVICNDSRLGFKDGKFTRTGEPTEAAIRVLVEKMGCPIDKINKAALQKEKRAKDDIMAFSDYWTDDFKKLATLEFNRDRKSMSVMGRHKGETYNTLYCKGAPENVIERCSHIVMPDGNVEKMTPTMQKKVMDDVQRMAGEALRCLALAYKDELGELSSYDGPKHKAHKKLDLSNAENIESGMTFIGLVGIMDPPRPECRQAIDECRGAGISVIMITGDNKLTAEAIATKLGIVSAGKDLSKKSFTGQEFDDMSDSKKQTVLKKMVTDGGGIFSRTEPKHKQSIVKILGGMGEIAAMTGDGVNDAPALKQASIGVAMGISGTEVAKEASDMILTDDNFSTIVSAVEEGRSIYNNMKAFIRYLISSNIGEVASIFFTAALGIPEGLSPVQLLWVNLVTDGPPATALGFNPPDVDAMTKPPRKKDDGLISGWVFFRYMVIGLYVGFATVGIFAYWYILDEFAPDGHTLVSLTELMYWGKCSEWTDFKPVGAFGQTFNDQCDYFLAAGKVKASTLSLSVLVVIEMLNALNALSEDGSLLQMPPWKNPYLILAICSSIGTHMIILYIPFLNKIFGTCPLDEHDWTLVMAFSVPVILIDEILKFVGRLTAVDARIQAKVE